jgi:hypothetical protein
MWIVLACFMGCGDDGVRMAREDGWRAAAALAGYRPDAAERPQWVEHWRRLDADTIDGFDPTVRHESQRACLRALRRALPEKDEGESGAPNEPWWFNSVIHAPDYIEWGEGGGLFQGGGMMTSGYYACFQEAPRVG